MQNVELQNTQNGLNSSKEKGAEPFLKKKFLKGYSKIHELKLVSIGLASPEKIQSWAEKELPNGKIFGEVTNANTFHYRTFQPTKGGLFCERIFGPLKDFECACGKRQKPTALESKKILEHKQTTRYFCSNCDVEYTWSIIRRYQLGYIQLNAPVTHLWYLKTNPSYLSIFFDMKKKDLEAVVYCTDSLTLENVWKYKEQKTNFSHSSIHDLYTSWQKLINFEKQKKNFEKHVFQKKQKKRKKREKDWKFLSFQKQKSNFFSPVQKIDQVEKKQNSEIFQNMQKEKNFSPVQLKISETLQYQKLHLFLFSLFEKIFQKNLKKRYGNILLEEMTKNVFFDNEKNKKTKFDFSKNLFFVETGVNSFFEKNFSEKNTQKVFLLFFFFFPFANSLVFQATPQCTSFFQENRKISPKRKIFFLFTIVYFFKKYQTFENFLLSQNADRGVIFQRKKMGPQSGAHFFPLEKKGKKKGKKQKKSNFFFQQPFFENVFQNSKNEFAFSQKDNEFSQTEFFSSELSEIFTSILVKKEMKKRKKFLSYLFENSPQKFLFSGEKHFSSEKGEGKKNVSFLLQSKFSFQIESSKLQKSSMTIFENTSQKQKSTLRVFNKILNAENTRLSSKKQKKLQEFLRSGFLLETIEKQPSLKEEGNQLFFQEQKISNFKKPVNFSYQTILQTKYQQNQRSLFLKNPLLTISYNFLWKNDSDWKYFVYYNSFFFSEFEDIPIDETFQTQFDGLNGNGEIWQKKGLSSHLRTERVQRKKAVDGKNQSFSFFENLQKHTQVGAGILEKFLTEYTPSELKKMIKQHQILFPKINKVLHSSKQMVALPKKESLKIQKYIQKREHIVRRLKFLRKFFRKNSNPTFMILRNLPVLPPDLRPVLKLQNQIAASDLNRFYQRIIYRNERLKKFSKDSATNQSFELRYAQRLLQEAVDNLIQNGKGGVKPETNSRGIPLKSLSEILKGKQGRFRQYLLGKRVDYSGRSVIVVGPKLKLYECGLPKEMAFELFLPFLIQQILQLNLAKTVIGAKNILKKDANFAFHLLKKIMKNIPVLLNRAPTLHRLGFQAFLPKLVEGRAILLHPMVCPGFNADFDGDQMAVHVPLTVEARTEAWKFMLSTNNFINSATGDPVLLPTQDMVLGCYYLTTDFHSKGSAVQIMNSLKKEKKRKFYDFQTKKKNFLFFSNFSDVFAAYQRKEISLHSSIWIRWNGFVDFGNDSTKPVEIQVRKNGFWLQIQPKKTIFSNQKNEIFSKFIRTTPGRIFMNFMIREFQKNQF